VVPYTFADNSKDIKGSFGSTRAGTTQGLNALELLHLRTGHSSEAVLKAGLKLNIFKGAQTTYAACRNLTLGPCEACLRGGMRADSVTVSSRDLSALKPMQEVGMDPVSLSTKTVDGNTVLNVGLCYGAKLMWAYPAKTDAAQSDVLRAIKRDYADPYGHVIETVHSDSKYCLSEGISQDVSAPHHHQHNLVEGGCIRVILNRARVLLSNSGLPVKFAEYAVQDAIRT